MVGVPTVRSSLQIVVRGRDGSLGGFFGIDVLFPTSSMPLFIKKSICVRFPSYTRVKAGIRTYHHTHSPYINLLVPLHA